jgi:hypothetical protein
VRPYRIRPQRASVSLTAGALAAALSACAHPPAPEPPWRAKYGAHATPFRYSHEYFQRATASDFWSLVPYYVPQRDDRSCSLASLTMLVNAARGPEPLGPDDPLVTQSLLFERVHSPVWQQGLAEGGEGVTLDQLAPLAQQSLAAFGIRAARTQVTHVPDTSPASLERFRVLLAANEASPDDWLLLNFDPAAYTGAGGYGHIAPVGAYDADSGRLLILDPDRTWYEPYWVSAAVALAGMATLDRVSGQPRGYLYVSISASAR